MSVEAIGLGKGIEQTTKNQSTLPPTDAWQDALKKTPLFDFAAQMTNQGGNNYSAFNG